jgi:tetratricopeptide (TPR) repeat protein
LARIDRLPARDKEAIQAAALIGKRFELVLLRHLIGDAAYTATSLLAQDLVRSDGTGLLFSHALIQESVYASLLHSRKRKLHTRAAEWFAERDAVLHAEHLDRAEVSAAAAAYLDAAAGLARAMQFDRALSLAERGCNLATASDAVVQHSLHLLRGQLLRELGRNRDALRAFEIALGAASNDTERCRNWIEVASTQRNLAAHAEALQALDKAQQYAEGESLLPDRARVHYLRGNIRFALGEGDACAAEHERALLLAREAGSAECEALALSGLGDAAYARGRMHAATDYFTACLVICESQNMLRFSILNQAMLAWSRYFCGDVAVALTGFEAANALARRLGHVNAEVMTKQSLSNVLAWCGELATALQIVESGLPLARAVGSRRYEAALLYQRGLLICRLGRQSDAMDDMRDCWGIVEEIGAYGFIGAAVQGGIAAAAESAEQRSKALARAEALLAEGALAHCFLWFYSEAMLDGWRRQHLDEIERYADALEQWSAAEPLAWVQHQVRVWRALVAFRRGGETATARAELESLRGEIERVGLIGFLPFLDAAIAA